MRRLSRGSEATSCSFSAASASGPPVAMVSRIRHWPGHGSFVIDRPCVHVKLGTRPILEAKPHDREALTTSRPLGGNMRFGNPRPLDDHTQTGTRHDGCARAAAAVAARSPPANRNRHFGQRSGRIASTVSRRAINVCTGAMITDFQRRSCAVSYAPAIATLPVADQTSAPEPRPPPRDVIRPASQYRLRRIGLMVLCRLAMHEDFIPHHEGWQGRASVQHAW